MGRTTRRVLSLLLIGLSGFALAASRAPARVSGAGEAPEGEAPAVEVAAAERRKAGELLARAVEALGGAARLDAVKSVETAGELATGRGAATKSRHKTILVFPDRLRQETETPLGASVKVVNGESGFVQLGPLARPLRGSLLAGARRRLRRDLLSLLRRRGDEGFVAVYSGAGEVDGVAVETVDVRLDGDQVALGIDAESGRVRSLSYGSSFRGRRSDLRQVFSDYREVGGLVLPFTTASTLNGRPFRQLTIDSIVVDGEVDEALFELPAESGAPRTR